MPAGAFVYALGALGALVTVALAGEAVHEIRALVDLVGALVGGGVA